MKTLIELRTQRYVMYLDFCRDFYYICIDVVYDAKKKKGGDKGQDGKDGRDGQDGQNGSSGKTAYELWVEEVINNCGKTTQVMNPHNPTEAWPCNKISLMDFFEYLRGKDGQVGVTPGVLVKGKPNVLAQYYNQALDEYVDSADESVTFWVFSDRAIFSFCLFAYASVFMGKITRYRIVLCCIKYCSTSCKYLNYRKMSCRIAFRLLPSPTSSLPPFIYISSSH